MPPPLVLVAALAGAAGLLLLVAGAWAWGLVALLVAAVALLVHMLVKRRTDGQIAGGAGVGFTARREVWAARSRGQLGLFRSRRELAELEAERGRGYQELGRAVFEQDEAAGEEVRARLDELSGLIRAKEVEIQAQEDRIGEQVRRARSGAPTAEPQEPPGSGEGA